MCFELKGSSSEVCVYWTHPSTY